MTDISGYRLAGVVTFRNGHRIIAGYHRSFHGTGLSGEGLGAVGSMTPAGGWDISKPEPKSGGCVQLATRLKPTAAPENSASAKPTVPPGNSASAKSTVPPENWAPLKSPPSKTAPAKSKFRPHQETGAVPLRCAAITRMTVWRTSRLAWKASRFSTGASPPGSGSYGMRR